MMADDIRRLRTTDSSSPREVSRDVAGYQRLSDIFRIITDYDWLRWYRSRSIIVTMAMSGRRGKRLRCLSEDLLSIAPS